jgi:hypothetical protein
MQDELPASAISMGNIDAPIQGSTVRPAFSSTSLERLPREVVQTLVAGPNDHFLVARCCAGDQDAATCLYLRYAGRVTNLVKRQCSANLAHCAGVEDIVQSVFGNFFRRVGQGNYQISDGDTVWRLLLVIALNAVRSHATFYYAAKRDAHRTISGAEARRRLQSESNARELASLHV